MASVASSQGPSRVTIVAPTTRMDLALPSEVPLAELLPAVLHHAGDRLADQGATEQNGWTLRRLGGPPLDTGRTAVELDIRDGELLYFTPPGTPDTEVIYDDVVDAVADATRRRPGRWTPADTRRFGVGLAVAALLGALVVTLFAGPPQTIGGIVGLVTGAVLIAVAALIARVLGDSLNGTLLAMVGVAYAGGSGLMLLAGARSIGAVAAPDLLLAGAGVMLFSALGLLAVGDYAQVFIAALITGLALVLGATMSTAWGATPAAAAAIVAVIVLASMPFHPMMSYWLGGLRTPSLPTGPDDLRSQAAPVTDGAKVLALSERAADFLVALTVAASIAAAGSIVTLITDGGLAPFILAALLSLLVLLRARPLISRSQRLPLLIAGGIGLGTVALAGFLTTDLALRLGLVAGGLGAVALISAVYGLGLAGKRISPLWGRLLDIAEILMIVAVVPMAAWTIGVFDWVATLGR